MGTLQKIVKVTQQQYDALKSGDTVGDYTGINSNYIYLVQEDYNDITYANLNNANSLGTIGKTSKLYGVGLDSNSNLAVKVPWTDNNTTYSKAIPTMPTATRSVRRTMHPGLQSQTAMMQ